MFPLFFLHACTHTLPTTAETSTFALYFLKMQTDRQKKVDWYTGKKKELTYTLGTPTKQLRRRVPMSAIREQEETKKYNKKTTKKKQRKNEEKTLIRGILWGCSLAGYWSMLYTCQHAKDNKRVWMTFKYRTGWNTGNTVTN